MSQHTNLISLFLKDWRQHSSQILIYSGSFISLMVNADMYLRRLRKQWQNKHWLKKKSFLPSTWIAQDFCTLSSPLWLKSVMICPDMMTLVVCVVYCNSKCRYWFRHSLIFCCTDRHYFKRCFVVMANVFVGKLLIRWPCAWFSTTMLIISQCISSSRRTPLSLGILVMFYQHKCMTPRFQFMGAWGFFPLTI